MTLPEAKAHPTEFDACPDPVVGLMGLVASLFSNMMEKRTSSAARLSDRGCGRLEWVPLGKPWSRESLRYRHGDRGYLDFVRDRRTDGVWIAAGVVPTLILYGLQLLS